MMRKKRGIDKISHTYYEKQDYLKFSEFEHDWGISHTPYGDIYHYDPGRFGGRRTGSDPFSDVPPISYSPDVYQYPGNAVDLGEITVSSDLPDTELMGVDEPGTNEPYLNTALAGFSVLMYPQQSILKFTLDIRNISAIVIPLRTHLLLALDTVLPIAGRMLGVAGILMPSSIAKDPPVIYYHDNSYGEGDDDPYILTTLPATLVTDASAEISAGKRSIPADVIVSLAAGEQDGKHTTVITPVKDKIIPVIKAEKTDIPGVYEVNIIPDASSVRITVINNVKNIIVKSEQVNLTPSVKHFIPASPEIKTHHAIIDFSGEHEPVYLFLSQLPLFEDIESENTIRLWQEQFPVEAARIAYQSAETELNNTTELRKKAISDRKNHREIDLGTYMKKLAYYRRAASHSGYLERKYAEQIQQDIDRHFDVINRHKIAERNFIRAEIQKNRAERHLAMIVAGPDWLHRIRHFEKRLISLTENQDTFLIDGNKTGQLQISVKGSGIIPQKNEEKPLFHDYLTGKKPDRNDSEDGVAESHSAVIIQTSSIAGQMAVVVPAGNIRISDGFAERNYRGLWIREKNTEKLVVVFDVRRYHRGKIPVINAIKDSITGVYKASLPSSATILINPVNPPIPPGFPGGISIPELKFPFHTGTSAEIPVTPMNTGFPLPDDISFTDFILVFPDGSGLKPVYIMLSSPYGETNAKGKFSGRNYHTERAGGPIEVLDWRIAVIDREGVDKVRLHISRFGSSADNDIMLERLEYILTGTFPATDTDKRFYTHEIRELERYRNLGIKDGVRPENGGEVWNNTHTATLEDYQLSSDKALLYTAEALFSTYDD
ncbi:colicin-like bacteriocin tRNase domain-containing protein [Morganella morganii]|uniref:colicin-like bacteriocin tRNase domain-containing protein n=1 Tax=Morganella morganii TaxID=582 RepID=UPI0034E4D03F